MSGEAVETVLRCPMCGEVGAVDGGPTATVACPRCRMPMLPVTTRPKGGAA